MSLDQKNFESQLGSLAKDLHANGILEIFGVVGDPITPLVEYVEELGIRYFGFRNEQAASYAASIVSFLTLNSKVSEKRLGVVLTVAGPGFTNALTGLANATVNGWPMLLICPLTDEPGAFQGLDQIAVLHGIAKGHVVYDGSSDSVRRAIDLAYSGVGGAVVLFVARKSVDSGTVHVVKSEIKDTNMRPTDRALIVLGSRAPFGVSSSKTLDLINKHRIPFFAEPMGRGVVPESHPLCVTAAKSLAMQTCSSAIIVGGQIDWMIAFGSAPKWSKNCQFVQVASLEDIDLSQTRIDVNWREKLCKNVHANKANLSLRLKPLNPTSLLSHWDAIGVIKRVIHEKGLTDCIIVSEGANTMDVARVALDDVERPCRRLDAGRWGTMGSGLGFTLAASQLENESMVITIQGDSAFGFSGMELETLVRYKCKALIIVFNNGGIYTGAPSNATAFSPNVCHDQLMTACGGYGFQARNANTLYRTLNDAIDALKNGKYPVLVDVLIDPSSGTISGSLSRL